VPSNTLSGTRTAGSVSRPAAGTEREVLEQPAQPFTARMEVIRSRLSGAALGR
jgi:hypothetical protein